MKKWLIAVCMLFVLNAVSWAQGSPTAGVDRWTNMSVAMPLTIANGEVSMTRGLALLNTVSFTQVDNTGVTFGGGFLLENVGVREDGRNNVAFRPMAVTGWRGDAGVEFTVGMSLGVGGSNQGNQRTKWHVSAGTDSEIIMGALFGP